LATLKYSCEVEQELFFSSLSPRYPTGWTAKFQYYSVIILTDSLATEFRPHYFFPA